MAPKFEEFLDYRNSLGYAMRPYRSFLHVFDRYLTQTKAEWSSFDPAFLSISGVRSLPATASIVSAKNTSRRRFHPNASNTSTPFTDSVTPALSICSIRVSPSPISKITWDIPTSNPQCSTYNSISIGNAASKGTSSPICNRSYPRGPQNRRTPTLGR